MFNEPLTMDELFEQNANYLFKYYAKIKKEEDENGEIIIPGFLMIKNICAKSNNENIIGESNLHISSDEGNENNPKKKKNYKDDESPSEKENKKTKEKPKKKRKYYAIKTCQNYEIKTEF